MRTPWRDRRGFSEFSSRDLSAIVSLEETPKVGGCHFGASEVYLLERFISESFDRASTNSRVIYFRSILNYFSH